MAEWKPVVGGRAMWGTLPVELVEHVDGGMVIVRRLDQGASVPVEISDLTEHPDDRRHRRLLDAARDLVNRGYDLQAVTRLQSAVQAIDQAEADHAS